MVNVNCLAGMRCPKCGQYEPLEIYAQCIVRMNDDGSDYAYAFEWGDGAHVDCPNCGHGGLATEFKTEEYDDQTP